MGCKGEEKERVTGEGCEFLAESDWVDVRATERRSGIQEEEQFGGRGRRVMSSVLEMLRLRCRWDFQFIFNTHENTLQFQSLSSARGRKCQSSGKGLNPSPAKLEIILSDSTCLEIRMGSGNN